jgi:hydrogenase/urease accessory protein HupE
MDKIHITDNLFFTISPTHENITDIHVGEHQEQHIFSIQRPTVDIDYHQIRTAITNGNIFTNIITFLTLGVKHIFGGTDHILFLLGLLLVATRFKSVLKIITAFTIAHSITLILSALNIFVLPARFTESMIALSIAYVAFENLKGTTHPRRWMIAFCFGLIHGFGFSSVLREIGLPHDGLILSLLSFNVGVEIGQLAIVSMIFPLLLFIQKHNWHTRFIKTVSIGIGIIGLFWFVQRAFFS